MQTSISSWPVSLLSLILGFFVAGNLAAAPSRESIDQSIERAMEEFQVPGMAVSVVYDGRVFYSEGHGVAQIDTNTPVTGATLFQIASVTKAFTAATLALLVDDGKVAWDSPVIDYIPEFRMYDPWVTREFTVRDMLTHRSGLPLGAGDLLMFPKGNATREDIIKAMRYLEPSTSFRSSFAYDNLFFVIASEIVTRVSGMPFEDFLEQRLLTPLGMKDCTATFERAAPGAVKATPHLLVDGELQITTAGITGVSAGAGGLTCSADSMARWMQLVLNHGATPEGEQIISTAQFDQLLQPATLLSQPSYMVEHAGSHLGAYALGWGVSTFYGQPMYSHSGGLWGMTSFVAILPQQGLAVFASNNQMSAAPRAIVNDLLDQFLSGVSADAGQDWIGIFAELVKARQERGAAAVAEAEASRNQASTPNLPLEAYTGTYRDPWYGDIHISLTDDGTLWFSSDRNAPLSGPLEHFQYDTFIARWTDRQLQADAYVSFYLTPEGKIERIRMKAVSPNTDFSYDFHDLDLKPVAPE